MSLKNPACRAPSAGTRRGIGMSVDLIARVHSKPITALSARRQATPGCNAPTSPLLSGRSAARSRFPMPAMPNAHRRSIAAAASAAGVPADDAGRDSEGAATPATAAATTPGPLGKLMSVLHVFSDPACNSKLLALAVGQMLCSIATLIHDSYLPIYVHEELGLSTGKIGAVQGAAQFLCQLSKGVSGVVGDVLGSQTRVLVFGTLLTFACKPMFAMLSTVYGVFGVTACLYWFFVAKLFDRLSKGIREAPTKAVMNELAKESGDAPDAAYGLRQSLATAGMLIGSTIASVTFAATGNNYILTFTVAAIPPALALLWLVANFKDELFGARPAPAPATPSLPRDGPILPPNFPPRPHLPPGPVSSTQSLGSLSSLSSSMGSMASVDLGAGGAAPEPVLSPVEKAVAILKAFKPAYWQALLVVAVLYFARFDASFLSLRAKAVMPKSLLPMLTLLNTLIQMLLTAPLSRYSGVCVANRNRLLLVGFVFMILADTCFALPATASAAGMFVGAGCIGLHMAMTHAITISMISSYMPTGVVPGVGKLSGTAVSFTDLLLGFVLAASNALAGVLADMSRAAGYGNVGCFAGGAAACVLSGILLLLFSRFGDLGRDDLIVKRKKKAA